MKKALPIFTPKGAASMLCAFIVLLSALALLLWPGAVSGGVASSLSYCLSTLVPSLFPFMVLAGFAVESPAALWLSRPLGFLARYLFRLPGCCAAPILMSFVGGYPAGAKGASLLLSRGLITRGQAGRMLMFCVNPGLAFTVTYLGVGVFGSAGLGWRLFLAVTVSSAVMGIVTGLFTPVPGPEAGQEPSKTPPGALARSVSGAARSVLIMCAYIVLFSGFSAMLHASGLFQGAVRLLTRLGIFTPQQWAGILSFLLEVTGGTGDARTLGIGPGLFAFGLAFGGVCVHMQVLSMFREPPIRTAPFLLCRLIHGLLAFGIFALLEAAAPSGSRAPALQVSAGAYRPELSGGWMGGASLLLMCAAFLLMVPEAGVWRQLKNRPD